MPRPAPNRPLPPEPAPGTPCAWGCTPGVGWRWYPRVGSWERVCRSHSGGRTVAGHGEYVADEAITDRVGGTQ